MAMKGRTIDPTQIPNASEIPPSGAQPVGLSAQGLVDVYCGTLLGDIDAQPAAKELLGAALDTGGLSNADYVCNQVSALYGGAQLPNLQRSSGDTVRSLIFVSGSDQGGYGAFHYPGTQADFDRIVVDSLNVSGSYSAGSGLGSAAAPAALGVPHLFTAYRGSGDLLGIIHADDPRLEAATAAAIREAHAVAAQSILALMTAIEARDASAMPRGTSSHIIPGATKSELARRLILANQDILGLVRAAARTSTGRQYLSTALFVAEIVESFQALTGKANPGRTDGEAVSRVVAFKFAPEISLIPGFNSAVTQQWWKDGHPDFVNVNSENDQSLDGNACGVMFLEFLTDFLGIPMDQVIKHLPPTSGAPLGQTYVSLLNDHPELAQVAGKDGKSAFQKMVSLLQKNAQRTDGILTLPADGNPFPSMPAAKRGGLFATSTASPGSLAQDAQVAVGLQAQVEQQLAALKRALQQIQGDVSAGSTPSVDGGQGGSIPTGAGKKVSFGYGPPLLASAVANLDQRVATHRAPQYDQTLQQEFWPHVYNELPGTGTNTDRLQVITGTNQTPEAVQITGTVTQTKLEPDGDLHISFQPDDPGFPTNQGAGESPLELEIIYAGPVTQADARQAQKGYTNPFDISHLVSGTRIQAAGPLIFDRAHGKADASGNVQSGLEIHPLAGMTVLSAGQGGGAGGGGAGGGGAGGGGTGGGAVSPLSADLTSALGQVGMLGNTLGSLTSVLQKMKGEAPTR